ncbi:hypothetical protein PQX77_001117 [Marasmius sp. AFHP31]|nr:hypothetical protein PQX77_001117 [Marasmius sp. AFHP31]
MTTKPPSSSSPIHTLPTELLREIFMVCCEEYNILVIHIGGLDKRIGPFGTPVLALSEVSSQWRELALSLGDLWSHIRYLIGQPSGIEKDDEADSQMCYEATKHYLDRAGTSPLTLSFHDNMDLAGTSRGAEFGLALDALCRRAPQWAVVEFEVEEIFFEQNAHTLQLLRGNLHNLHTFISHEGHETSILRVTELLGPFASLREVTLERLSEPPPRDLLPTILPWEQLDRLTLTDCSTRVPDIVFKIISLCSNLRHLTFSVSECDSKPLAARAQAMSWSNVHTLTITENAHESLIFQDFLQWVTLPVLTCLEFQLCGWYYMHGARPKSKLLSEEQEARLHNFIRHSGASIASLTLHNFHITNDQLVDLLQLLPSVTDLFIADGLSLGFTWYDPSSKRMDTVSPSLLFDRLQAVDPASDDEGTHPRSGPFLTRLTDLTIGANGTALAHDALAKAVHSRWIPDPETSARLGVDSLRSVEVFFIDTEPTLRIPESLLSLQDLRCAGLRVVLPDLNLDVVVVYYTYAGSHPNSKLPSPFPFLAHVVQFYSVRNIAIVCAWL